MTEPDGPASLTLSNEDTFRAGWRSLLLYSALVPLPLMVQVLVIPMLSSSYQPDTSFLGLLAFLGLILLIWAVAALIACLLAVVPMTLGALIAIGLREPLSRSRRPVVHALVAGGIAFVLAAATIVAVELINGGPFPWVIDPNGSVGPILRVLEFSVPAFVAGVLGWCRTYQLAKRPQRPVSWGALAPADTSSRDVGA